MIRIDKEWVATLFCALEDAIKYNDSLRHSQTVKDVEDIEEWLMQLFQCKEYLQEQITQKPELTQKLAKYLQRYCRDTNWLNVKIIYHEQYNIDVGIFKFLHPFDGCKFSKVRAALNEADIIAPPGPIAEDAILSSLNELLKIQLKDKAALCRALEIPKIPFLSFSWLDSRILSPMRWGVAGTLTASRLALTGTDAWNLAGGYHHASPHRMEGFCIYNDINISYQQLIASGELTADDNILIIDIDAHHGNGNARTFIDNANVTLLDIYNADIYPIDSISRRRVDIAVPLPSGTGGELYLNKLAAALDQLSGGYKLAFVVAGTDVLATDPLGGLQLSVDDVAQSHKLVYQRLKALHIPTVFLGGGGYGKDSAAAIVAGVKAVSGNSLLT